jgi:hypothetical protein
MQNYIDSRLDILENKFLFFVCNVSEYHWISIVVANPFLVVAEGGTDGDDNDRDDFFGWCVLDSNSSHAASELDGFQGTVGSKNKASYGVRLFLNICASYLKAKKNNDGDGRKLVSADENNPTNEAIQEGKSFFYEEPFGSYKESLGTVQFPRFDFVCPSVIQQATSFNCGLAVVANSIMAFMIHLRETKFMRCDFETPILLDENDFCLQMSEDIYSL